MSEPIPSGIWEAIDNRILNRVTDTVLAYRPKPKTKAAKRRIRTKKRLVLKIRRLQEKNVKDLRKLMDGQ